MMVLSKIQLKQSAPALVTRKNGKDDRKKMIYFIRALVFNFTFNSIFSNAPDVGNINQLL